MGSLLLGWTFTQVPGGHSSAELPPGQRFQPHLCSGAGGKQDLDPEPSVLSLSHAHDQSLHFFGRKGGSAFVFPPDQLRKGHAGSFPTPVPTSEHVHTVCYTQAETSMV